MIHFYEKRKIFFAISAAILLLGLICIFINGVNLDIQFKGGVIMKYTYDGQLDNSQVQSVVESTLNRSASVQTTNDLATGANKLVVNLSGNEGISVQEQSALESALKETFTDNHLALSESNIVEPFIGKRFLQNGILALVLSFSLIVLYVWVRFRQISGFSAGVMALLALVHDCLVVFFVFVIFKLPVNESFIAVLLTIIGYSINDTIIIYDRIRENKHVGGKTSIEDLVNKSITQSMSRSINTACTTFVSAIVILLFAYLYGIDSIVIFALPMAVGLVSGCYSSICIAGPLWVMWQKHKEKAKAVSHIEAKA